MRALLLIPAYNEEAAVAGVIRACRRALPAADVLVINDGSADATAERARAAGARVLDLPYNLGIGGAVQAGYLYGWRAGYDVICQVDGDGQHDPGELAALLAPICSGQADYVVGSRFRGRGAYRAPLARRLGIWVFSLLLRLMTGRTFTDPTSGFRAAGARAIARFAHWYPVDYPEVEALMLAHQHALCTVEVPVRMAPRQAGRSSITTIRAAYYMIKVSLALALRASALRPR